MARARLSFAKSHNLVAAVICLMMLVACAPSRKPVPLGTIPTARAVTVSEEQYGHTVLTQLSKQHKLDYNDNRLDKIIEIVDNLTEAINANKDPWHVFLFKAPTVINAGATRGNHVFIWSGMLDTTHNDAELATILAHEIAHVLIGHTDPDPNEEAKKLLIGVGAIVAGAAISSATGNPNLAANLGKLTVTMTQQVGNELLVYPYTREMEFEADHVGLMIMASAKYDPHMAVAFWERVQNDPNFGSQMKYFTTHPAAKDRLAKLKQALPLAMQFYSGKRVTGYGSIKTPPLSVTSEHVYKITQEGAILYRAPSMHSIKLGEFSKGTNVVVSDTIDAWLEISNPDHGYLLRSNASKNASKKD